MAAAGWLLGVEEEETVNGHLFQPPPFVRLLLSSSHKSPPCRFNITEWSAVVVENTKATISVLLLDKCSSSSLLVVLLHCEDARFFFLEKSRTQTSSSNTFLTLFSFSLAQTLPFQSKTENVKCTNISLLQKICHEQKTKNQQRKKEKS